MLNEAEMDRIASAVAEAERGTSGEILCVVTGEVSDYRETPLAWAAMTGNVLAAQALLERGAIVNAADENGNTPLHGAAAAGNADVVQLLLSRRADAALRNREGRTARDLAIEHEQQDVARLLPP